MYVFEISIYIHINNEHKSIVMSIIVKVMSSPTTVTFQWYYFLRLWRNDDVTYLLPLSTYDIPSSGLVTSWEAMNQRWRHADPVPFTYHVSFFLGNWWRHESRSLRPLFILLSSDFHFLFFFLWFFLLYSFYLKISYQPSVVTYTKSLMQHVIAFVTIT